MIDTKSKKILVIDLEKQTFETKSFADMNKFLGGVALGLKLLEQYLEEDAVILSVGPLNGFFPFASKTSIVLRSDGMTEDIYIGGSLSTRIKFSGIDAIILNGKSAEEIILDIQNTKVSFHDKNTDITGLGLPGKKSLIFPDNKNVLSDYYFTTPEDYLEKKFTEKNIAGISITGTETFSLNNFEEYKKLYLDILNRKNELRVDEDGYPSCSNCPMGCGKSKVGEIGGNVIVNSLVACQFADKIYTDIGTVFSCLNVLGYDYTHEDIENLPKLIEKTIRNIS